MSACMNETRADRLGNEGLYECMGACTLADGVYTRVEAEALAALFPDRPTAAEWARRSDLWALGTAIAEAEAADSLFWPGAPGVVAVVLGGMWALARPEAGA